MSGYSVKRADAVIPGQRGYCVVDTSGALFAPHVLGHVMSYGEASTKARELNAAAQPTRRRVRKSRYSGSIHTVGDADGRDFDNLGESPDY